MNIKIKLDLKGHIHELTIEELRALQAKLDQFLGKPADYPAPLSPLQNPPPWSPMPWNPFLTWPATEPLYRGPTCGTGNPHPPVPITTCGNVPAEADPVRYQNGRNTILGNLPHLTQ